MKTIDHDFDAKRFSRVKLIAYGIARPSGDSGAHRLGIL